MPPFPPSIVNALLRERTPHDPNPEVRVLLERYERSRFRWRRPLELRARRDARGDGIPARPATDVGLQEAA
jgi:hypothetical protein